jgi:peptidoglycan/xylan/chitin deacetylase (PgdA/CDA1 family)
VQTYKTGFIILFIFLNAINAQQIAITFDDAPKSDGKLYKGIERTGILMNKLKRLNISEAAFFCNTAGRDLSDLSRLKMYADAGHIIANHSHSHYSLNSMPAKEFYRDILRADSTLLQYGTFQKWFRFPFLHEGNSNARRDSIRNLLKTDGYINGYVTIGNYDWYIDNLLKNALSSNQNVDYDKLADLYIKHIWESILFYDAIARKALNRSPRHVLLLHENDCAALFIDKLVEHIRSNGWEIISPAEAFKDSIADYHPETLFNNQGRVAAIAAEKGFIKRELIQESEDEDYLDELFRREKVFAGD